MKEKDHIAQIYFNMTRIYIGDHLGAHKTTIQLEKWLTAKGHEVHWDTYYENKKGPTPDQHWIEWADVIFFEWLEGMVELCLKDGWGKKKPVYARAMDIEIWAGNANGADLTDLKGLAYTSQAIFDMYNREQEFTTKYPNIPVTHIPLSIDMNDWTFQSDKSAGYLVHKVAVIGHMWDAKGANLIPHFVRYLIDRSTLEGKKTKWEFYIQGDWRHDVWRWYLYYTKHIIKEMGLEDNIFISENRIENLDTWLNDKNFLVTFSMKDAFSLIVGEALVKGIKALPHNFPGAKAIWGDYVWTTFDELYNKLINDVYDPEANREFVKTRYSNEIIMPKFEKFIGL